MSTRITSLVVLKITSSSASLSVLVNLAELQQGLQKSTLTIPACVIWEGDIMVTGKALLDSTSVSYHRVLLLQVWMSTWSPYR